MMHEISEQNWEAYLEDQLAADERDRMEAHMLGCLTC